MTTWLVAASVLALVTTTGGLLLPAPVAAASCQERILGTADPISYWQLTEDSGDFEDAQSGHTAAVSGSPTRLATGPLASGDEGAVDFGSAGDYLTVADHADLDLGDWLFTIELWLRRDEDTGLAQIALTKGTDGYQLGISADDKLFLGKAGGAVIVEETGTTPADGAWHHVAVSRTSSGTGGTVLYKDGVDVTSEVAPATTIADTSSDLVIGRATSADRLGGALAQLAIYGRALTAGEVADHYHAGLDPCPQHGPWVIHGTSGDDILTGTSGADFICGLSGNDEIDGLGGNDVLVGGPGDDTLDGGAGEDELVGGEGNDQLSGGPDNDALHGEAGGDDIGGDGGDDFVMGGAGDDLIDGGADNDNLAGGEGADTIYGGTGRDLLAGTKSSESNGTSSRAAGPTQ